MGTLTLYALNNMYSYIAVMNEISHIAIAVWY